MNNVYTDTKEMNTGITVKSFDFIGLTFFALRVVVYSAIIVVGFKILITFNNIFGISIGAITQVVVSSLFILYYVSLHKEKDAIKYIS